LDYGRVGP